MFTRTAFLSAAPVSDKSPQSERERFSCKVRQSRLHRELLEPNTQVEPGQVRESKEALEGKLGLVLHTLRSAPLNSVRNKLLNPTLKIQPTL